MIDLESILITALISAIMGSVLRKITGVDIVGLISTVVIVSVVLYFVYALEPSPMNIVAFMLWFTTVIISLAFEEAFSVMIGKFSGERHEYR